MNEIFIYKLFSTSCDLVYIGKSKNICNRLYDHRQMKSNCTSRKVFENSENKKDVTIERICTVYDKQIACELEKFFIQNTANCVNKIIPISNEFEKIIRRKQATKKYFETHREKWNAYMRQWNLERKEKKMLLV